MKRTEVCSLDVFLELNGSLQIIGKLKLINSFLNSFLNSGCDFYHIKQSFVKAFPLKIKPLWTTWYHLGRHVSVQTNFPLSGQNQRGPLSVACRLLWKILNFEYILGPWPDPCLWMQLEDEEAGCPLQGLVVKEKCSEAEKSTIKQ